MTLALVPSRAGGLDALWSAPDAVVLHVDLAGFSTLARALADEGPRGAERLAGHLDAFFEATIGAVRHAGGMVATFAGDALVALWPEAGTDGEGFAAAAGAGLDIAATLPPPLKARISLASGAVELCRFGGEDGAEMWATLGPAISEAARLNGAATPGEIVVCPADAARASALLELETRTGGMARLLRRRADTPAPRSDPGSLPRPDHDRTPLALLWRQLNGSATGGAFRDLVVLSVDLAQGGEGAVATPERLAARLKRVRAQLAPWGGVPVNMMAEEKGIILHAVIGLPPQGPAERERRALRAAAAIWSDTGEGGARMPAGVAGGRLFFSRYGHPDLRTVSTFGWPSALATRLMQGAHEGPLTDAATALRSGAGLAFTGAHMREVKGASAPVEVVRLADPSIPHRRQKEARAAAPAVLAPWLARPGRPRAPAEIVGPRGIGKSHMLAALAAAAHGDGWTVAEPVLRPDGADLPYDALLRVLGSLGAEVPALGRPHGAGERQQKDIEDDLAERLSAACGTGTKCLILIDDAQYLDTGSRVVLERLAMRGALRVVLARRGATEPAPAIAVPPLTPRDSARLLCTLLNARLCEPETARRLHAASEGNPLFLEELARGLAAEGRLSVTGDTVRLPTAEPASPDHRSLAPGTLRDLVAARLDQLETADRALLSAAAVIGRRFGAGALAALAQEPEVTTRLARLAEAGLVRPLGEDQHAFGNDLVWEVSYDALSFAQRSWLHERVIELSLAEDLAERARHFAGAERQTEAVAAHQRLAEQAVALFAHAEALSHASEARRRADEHGVALAEEDRLSLLMVEGEAGLEAVEMRMAEARLQEALALAGTPVAAGAAGRMAQLLPALGRQVLHRVAGHWGGPVRHGALMARAHRLLAEIAYFDSRIDAVLLHTLASLNTAERVGQVREIVAGFAALSIGFETSGMHTLADFYSGRSREVAEARGDRHDVAFASLVAQVMYGGRADWPRAREMGERAMALYADLGATGRWRQTVATILHNRMAQGLLTPEDPLLDALGARMDSRVSAQIRSWWLTARLGAAFQKADPLPGSAKDALRALRTHPHLNPAEQVLAQATLAMAELRDGDLGAAREEARQALDLAEARPPAAWHVHAGLSWLATVTGVVAEARPDDTRAAAEDRRALMALARFAKTMPVARPAAAFHRDVRNVTEWAEAACMIDEAGPPATAHMEARRAVGLET